MDLYFFLDSKLFDPAITISSFAPSASLAADSKVKVFVCYAYPAGDCWVIATYMQMTEHQSSTILWADLGIPRDLISSTVVFLSDIEISGNYKQLPLVSGFSSIPSWRANLQIIGNGMVASYQGEFPYEMTKVKGGSIVSLIPFIQKSTTIQNYLFFASFEINPIHNNGLVEIRNIKSMQTLAKFNIDSNKVNFIDLQGIESNDGQLMIVATGIMGIPIFFSTDEDGAKMSVEHTMTPSEYAIYGEQEVKRSIMKRMKAYWS